MKPENLQAASPPGELIDIGNACRLHVVGMGEGEPPVVLECGSGGIALDWYFVQQEIARFTRVLAYDRAGSGWSDASRAPRAIPEVVGELHSLLVGMEIPRPFILVGHSLGGLYAQYFARRYPGEVGGLVLVDAAHPRIYQHLPPALARKNRGELRMRLIFARLGILRFGWLSVPMAEKLPAELRKLYAERMLRPAYWSSLLAQNKYMNADIPAMFDALDPFPHIPVTVLTPRSVKWLADITPDLPRLWHNAQKELARLSPIGRLKFVNGSHSIPEDAPKAIVDAVAELVIKVRKI
jgi:pimeloyl-ACP methyl ester carboxylesterase